MEYQANSRSYRKHEVRVGQNDQEIAVFRKAGFLIYNLKGEVAGVQYQLKLPAPWTGFRYRLSYDQNELASAKRHRRMHAFEPDRPLIRHNLVEFSLDIGGRAHTLVPEDRHGLSYVIREGQDQRGSQGMRAFEEQRESVWRSELQVPDEWPVPLVAFVAWLTEEGRSAMR